jgi:hypothetical protein
VREKSASRNLTVAQDSLQNPQVIARSEADYRLLGAEITSSLPKFALAYGAVRDYYESLPWA